MIRHQLITSDRFKPIDGAETFHCMCGVKDLDAQDGDDQFEKGFSQGLSQGFSQGFSLENRSFVACDQNR